MVSLRVSGTDMPAHREAIAHLRPDGDAGNEHKIQNRCNDAKDVFHWSNLQRRNRILNVRLPPKTDVSLRPIADISRLPHSNAVRLPTGSMKELRKALDDAQPRWAKIYMWVIGAPAWGYLVYHSITSDSYELGQVGVIAFIAFMTAVAVQMAVLFRAFWRGDI